MVVATRAITMTDISRQKKFRAELDVDGLTQQGAQETVVFQILAVERVALVLRRDPGTDEIVLQVGDPAAGRLLVDGRFLQFLEIVLVELVLGNHLDFKRFFLASQEVSIIARPTREFASIDFDDARRKALQERAVGEVYNLGSSEEVTILDLARRVIATCEHAERVIDRLDELDLPMLVVVGELDMPGIHEIADMLVAANPNAERVTVPGVGHYVNLEAPERFNELLVGYLEGF